MIQLFHISQVRMLLFLLFIIGLASYTKDKIVPCPEPEPTKYELISGDYKVYDTLGGFLYDMNINYIQGPVDNGIPRDTIVFENFDGEFNFAQPQGYNPGNPELYIKIGQVDTLFDSQGKRWKLLNSAINETYDNTFLNDTIKIRFHKTNINYWIEDAVPFYECYCKQIAVKQH